MTLGDNEVIRGWEAGLKKMCKGENRTLVIPPSLAYGANPQGTCKFVYFFRFWGGCICTAH